MARQDNTTSRGNDDPAKHDAGDDKGHDDPTTHDTRDDKGVDDTATHHAVDDKAVDDPTTHDVGDDKGVDDPATHDVGDAHRADDPATHDAGDDRGVDNPAAHDVGDDHGGATSLQVVRNARTGQTIFTDDKLEAQRWSDDYRDHGISVTLPVPAADDHMVSVWRFHDPASDVFFWTADDKLKTDLVAIHPEIEFQGEAFRAFADDGHGAHHAIGLVWDQGASGYGNFIYAPVDDAIKLAGQSGDDALMYLGVSFWI